MPRLGRARGGGKAPPDKQEAQFFTLAVTGRAQCHVHPVMRRRSRGAPCSIDPALDPRSIRTRSAIDPRPTRARSLGAFRSRAPSWRCMREPPSPPRAGPTVSAIPRACSERLPHAVDRPRLDRWSSVDQRWRSAAAKRIGRAPMACAAGAPVHSAAHDDPRSDSHRMRRRGFAATGPVRRPDILWMTTMALSLADRSTWFATRALCSHLLNANRRAPAHGSDPGTAARGDCRRVSAMQCSRSWQRIVQIEIRHFG
jgi:hypothetical protein